MNESLLNRILKDRKRRTRSLALILCLSMIVSLGTFAGFHKTAVAKVYTREVLDCPYTHEGAEPVAHVHNDDCYDGETLVCTLPELEAHTHSDACYTERQVLTCTLEENPGHQHGDACYTEREELRCGLEENPGHQHGDTCYTEREVLRCGLEENPGHQHGETCYDENGVLTCQIPEGEGAHTHTAECYETVRELTCQIPEGEGAHTHTAECYGTVRELTCQIPEGEGAHTHTAECYETVRELTCGKQELTPHVHGPECIRKEEITVDEPEVTAEPAAATQPEATAVPEMPVSDPNADLESASDWERDFDGMELSGNWAEDLVLVAATQQGHGESQNNFEAVLNDAGDAWVKHGYTRYGAWSGAPYADEWSAMFVSFCLRYAGIPAENVPNSPTAALMAESFQKGELFAGPDYLPAVGDLIFFDTDDEEGIDHMGIVYHVDEEDGSINAVEGSRTDAVETFGYKLDDEEIAGYGILPQNPNFIPIDENIEDVTDDLIVMTADEEEEKKETEEVKPVEETKTAEEVTVPAVPMPAQSWERTAGGIKVTVDAPEGAFPENTKIAVTPVNGNSLKDTVSDAVSGEVLEVQAVDITFFDADGNEIEPAVPIRVVMTPAETEHAEEKANVVHVDLEQQTAEVIEQATGTETDNSEVVFDAEAFTIYAIVYTYDVHFEYEVDGKTYTPASSMPGAKDLSLADVVRGLGIVEEQEIDTFVSKISTVASTDEAVVSVGQDGTIRVLKDGEAQIVITMQDAAQFNINVAAEGETEVSDENNVAVVSTVNDLYLPSEAAVTAEVLDEAKSENAIAAVQTVTEPENSPAADAAYQVFEISLDGVEATDYNGFQVEVKLPENVIGRDFRLFHIHDGETTEINLNTVSRPADDTGLEVVSGFIFETNDFSEFVLKYTVDFTYEGRRLQFPGQGSYRLADILAELGIEGTIDDAVLTLVEGEEHEGALYLSQNDGEYFIHSDIAFTDLYELRVQTGEKIYLITVTDAQLGSNHSELKDMLTGATISIDGQDETGSTWEVKKGQSYEVTLSFSEVPGTEKQIDTENGLTYQLPAAFKASALTKDMVLTYTDGEGRTQTLTGNSFTVDPATNTITLNLDAETKSKIESSGKTSFEIKLNGSFDQSASGVEWSDSISRNIIVDANHDVTVEKTGTFDPNTDTITYVVAVTSAGFNTNIDIADNITGTALTFNKDVTVSNNQYYQTGPSTAPSVNYGQDNKSFTVDLPSMNNGEVVYIKYTAAVDRSKLTGTATASETSNGVKVNGDDIEEKQDETDFANKIEIKSLSKNMEGYTGGETKTISWKIVYNADHSAEVAGRTVTDTIATNSQSIMKYSGAGIKVTWYDSNDQPVRGPETIFWNNLNAHSDSSWTWQVPNDDRGQKYKYVIEYTTEANVGQSISETVVGNKVQESGGGKIDRYWKVGPGFDAELNKTVTYDEEKATWTISFKVPKNGLDKAVVTDTLPAFGQYLDALDGEVTVSGNLLSDERYSIDTSDPGKVIVTFYQDTEKKVPGLKASDDERTITIVLSTAFSEEWMRNYPAGTHNSVHINKADLNGKLETQASVTPTKPEIIKTGTQVGEYNGMPVYKYTLTIRGYNGTENLTVTDTYDKDLTYLNIRNPENPEQIVVEQSGIFSGAYWEEVLYPFGDSGEKIINVNVQETTGTDTNSFSFTVDKETEKLKDTGGNYFPSYMFSYYLTVKNQDALDDLNQRSIAANGKIQLRNTASWNGATEGASVDVDYQSPVVQKTLLNKDQIAGQKVADENIIAQFQIILNESGAMLNNGQPMPMTDKFTNLSVDYATVKVYLGTQNGDSITWTEDAEKRVTYNYKETTGTFNIPDETPVKITYDARVTVADLNVETAFGNTATMKGFSDTIDEKTTAGGSGSGKVPEYAIRIFKYDGKDMTKAIPGAVYTMTDADGNPILYSSTAVPASSEKPYVDVNGVSHTEGARAGQPITFQTTDGYLIFKLSENDDGISLQPGIRYHFKETHAPEGYQLSNVNYSFMISDNPNYDNWEYHSGDNQNHG